MFKQTVSFWRRLLQAGSPGGASCSVADDRRQSARVLVDQQVRYCPAGSEPAEWLPGTVRNVSAGGLSLRADRPYTPGDLLNIELPHSTENNFRVALVCIVHITEEAEQQWNLGCTFARELNAEDLQAFDLDGDLETDKRSRPRYKCAIEARYQIVDAENEKPTTAASVLNISTTGVSLLAAEPITPGKLLNVELLSGSKTAPITVLCCVVHETHQEEDTWAIGCNFISEISEAELESLLV